MAVARYSGIPAAGIPVYASAINFPSDVLDGTQAVAADTNTIYVYDTSIPGWQAVATPGAAIAITALTGEVTATGPGAVAATISNAAVTNAKMAAMANNTVKGNKSGGPASPSDLALADVTEATSSVLTISNGSKTVVGSSNLTIQVLQSSAMQSGYLSSADWTTFNSKVSSVSGSAPISSSGGTTPTISISNFVGATSLLNGSAGAVPAPSAGDEGKYLKGDGSWATVTTLPAYSIDKVLYSTASAAEWRTVGTGSSDSSYPTDTVILGATKPVGLGVLGINNVIIGNSAATGLTDGYGNVLIGKSCATNLQDGFLNVFIGTSANTSNASAAGSVSIGPSSTVSTYSTSVGFSAQSTSNSVAVGFGAVSTGNQYSVAVGRSSSTAGGQSVALGALAATQSALDSIAIGYSANSGTANNNIVIGTGAGRDASTGANNVIIGSSAGNDLTSGYESIMIGRNSGTAITSGFYNTLIGDSAGSTITTGFSNVLIGTNASVSAAGDFQAHAMGYNTVAAQRSIAIGANVVSGQYCTTVGNESSSSGSDGSIVLGAYGSSGGLNGVLAVGGASRVVDTAYMGAGADMKLNASDFKAFKLMTQRAGFGGGLTNINGSAGTLTIAGAQGSGNAPGGDVIISTAPAGASGNTLNAHVEQLRVTATSNLKLSCGLTVKSIHNQTGTADVITVLVSDYYIGINASGSTSGITVNLPAAATAGAGKQYVFKDENGSAATKNITIDPNSSELIDGSSTYVMAVNYESVTVVCDGTNWFIV